MTIPSEGDNSPKEQPVVAETHVKPNNSLVTWTKTKLAGVVSLVAVTSLVLGSFLGVGFTLKVLELEHNYGHFKMMERPAQQNMDKQHPEKRDGLRQPSDREDPQVGLDDSSADDDNDSSDENNDVK